MKELIISIPQKIFVFECVKSNCRIDGRRITEARRADISLGPSWGFAEVTFDNTHAVASTTVEAITPSPERRSEGLISVVVELSPTSSEPAARDSLFSNSGSFIETRNCIENFVRESRAVDTEALCILAGVKVWSVRVHVDIINDDGNCIDVCMLAVMASLMHARRPEITVTGKEVRIHSLDEREPVALPVHHVPICVTFALYGAGRPYDPDTVLLDPVKLEEVASNGSMSLSFNSQGEVCGVYKAGGLPLHLSSFNQATSVAANRARDLTQALKTALSNASAQHPLSTMRPMLVDPEPIAMLAKVETNGGKLSMPTSTWNATPAADVAPPDIDAYERNHRARPVGESEIVHDVFMEEKRRPLLDKMGDVDLDGVNKMAIDKLVQSNSESSDDDLGAAIIPKAKHKPKKNQRR